jgi:aryl-alcohol dehydrogenase-like predicted oxidoreductase
VEYKNVGTSGLRVSIVGVGCNNFGGRTDVAASRQVIDRAIDLGVTLFDTADIYAETKSESALGEILGRRRGNIILATKFAGKLAASGHLNRGSRSYIMSAVEASLRRLKTDYIDLYQMHFLDPLTPIEETLRALDDLVHSGKVRYIGSSNFPGWQIANAQWTAKSLGLNAFVSSQEEYSLLVRDIEREVVPAAGAFGLGLLPYFPLASGFLTGKYKRNEPLPEGSRMARFERFASRFMTDGHWNVVERLTAFSEERGHTLLELAFSWLAVKPEVASVIAGATKPEQIDANVAAATWKLTVDELAEIDRLSGVVPKKAEQ